MVSYGQGLRQPAKAYQATNKLEPRDLLSRYPSLWKHVGSQHEDGEGPPEELTATD